MNSLVLITKKSKNHLFYLIIFIGVFLFPVNNSTLISGIPLINKYVTIIIYQYHEHKNARVLLVKIFYV